jgi:hypothetical protein
MRYAGDTRLHRPCPGCPWIALWGGSVLSPTRGGTEARHGRPVCGGPLGGLILQWIHSALHQPQLEADLIIQNDTYSRARKVSWLCNKGFAECGDRNCDYNLLMLTQCMQVMTKRDQWMMVGAAIVMYPWWSPSQPTYWKAVGFAHLQTLSSTWPSTAANVSWFPHFLWTPTDLVHVAILRVWLRNIHRH